MTRTPDLRNYQDQFRYYQGLADPQTMVRLFDGIGNLQGDRR